MKIRDNNGDSIGKYKCDNCGTIKKTYMLSFDNDTVHYCDSTCYRIHRWKTRRVKA